MTNERRKKIDQQESLVTVYIGEKAGYFDDGAAEGESGSASGSEAEESKARGTGEASGTMEDDDALAREEEGEGEKDEDEEDEEEDEEEKVEDGDEDEDDEDQDEDDENDEVWTFSPCRLISFGMLPIRQLLNETATDGGTETAETIRQVVRDHEALGARKEPGRNADSSSIVDDTSRKTNMLVSDEKSYKIKFFYRLDKVMLVSDEKNYKIKFFYRLDKAEQRETMRCWLTQKKSSKYNSLNARKKEDYLNRHVKQLILRSIDQQGVALPSSAAPAILAVADEPRHSPQQASL
ncbi:hypothetical protein V498_06461, partial [Pseudogymnoascus sp. VKM F-4517 (FW-2822)]